MQIRLFFTLCFPEREPPDSPFSKPFQKKIPRKQSQKHNSPIYPVLPENQPYTLQCNGLTCIRPSGLVQAYMQYMYVEMAVKALITKKYCRLADKLDKNF